MYTIEFPLGGLDADAVESTLFEIGASSITFVDRGDEPVLEPKPGEVRLWSDTLVRALFQAASDPTRDAVGHIDHLATTFGPHITATARLHAVEDQEWQRVWLTDWK